MKKAVFFIVFFFVSAITQTLAQPMNRAGMNVPGVQQLIVEYGDELQLTDEQISQLIELQIEHRNQYRAYGGTSNRGDRGNFRRNRNVGGPGIGVTRFNARAEMREEVMEILTTVQIELLQSKLVEKAERAHEFRTLRHEYIVREAGIENGKAGQVMALLNAQSESYLELAKQRIMNPADDNTELFAEQFQQMRETDDELQNLLTADEYFSLRENMGSGFGNRPHWNRRKGARMWSR